MQTRYRYLPALLAAFVLTATSACAAQVYGRYPAPGRHVIDDRGYRVGYESGFEQGRDDARRGRSFDHNRHREFRNADRGYGGYGNRNEYRQVFRQGFSAGYSDGYRRFDRNDRNGGRPYPEGRYPNPDGRYPNGSQGGAVYRSPAAEIGFRDGYSAGRDDARDGDRYDPVRAKRYREGDHDYNSRYGSRDAYKDQYREAFQQGYERGYREVRR